jgi:hypothetical protein
VPSSSVAARGVALVENMLIRVDRPVSHGAAPAAAAEGVMNPKSSACARIVKPFWRSKKNLGRLLFVRASLRFEPFPCVRPESSSRCAQVSDALTRLKRDADFGDKKEKKKNDQPFLFF